jgi:hypothetical protein
MTGQSIRANGRDIRKILIPFRLDESISLKDAAVIAGKCERTLQLWCARYGVGRRIGWCWYVSRVALAMHMDGNKEALAAYHAGTRTGPLVAPYYERAHLNSQTPQGPQARELAL